MSNCFVYVLVYAIQVGKVNYVNICRTAGGIYFTDCHLFIDMKRQGHLGRVPLHADYAMLQEHNGL